MSYERDDPIRVEIRLHGHLDQHWSTWFGGLTLAHEPDGTTTLRGHLTDQAQLHGLLARVRDVGASLISVTSSDFGRDRGGAHPARECPP